MTTAEQIRCFIAPIEGGQILLPGSTVAEVANYDDVRAAKETPGWVLGSISWQDWNVPVISFAMLAGSADKEDAGSRSRILIIKSLNGASGTPYLGLLINGVPRMANVKSADITAASKNPDHPCVFSEVTLKKSRILIPDFDVLDQTVQAALTEKDG